MKKSGFTLIELIFVIVIIGLLAAVAVPKFLTVKKNAETANIPDVGKQVVNKATSMLENAAITDLKTILDNDKEIKNYLDGLSNKGFAYDLNASQLDINYTGPDNTVNHVCLTVKRLKKEVIYNKDTNVTSYAFDVTDLNQTCNVE